MKIKNILSLVAGCCLLVIFFSGCVTLPVKEALPTYNINGVTYIPLVSLCELKGMDWKYDVFSRTVILSKDNHNINLMVGDNLVLVDGLPKNLRHPVGIYQGTVIVPYKFKEEILDSLFKESPFLKAGLPLPQIKRVVLDAGHGGNDPGAIGRTGLREKNITLDVAKRLGSLLNKKGIEVIMTRSRDAYTPLYRRVDIANDSGADLFISIHANANPLRSMKGFEVYYILPGITNDAQWAKYAAENINLNLDKSYFASSSLTLKAILWDLIHSYNRAESVELARSICKTIREDVNIPILRIKGKNFYVLKGVYMPAILIEIGFLSNDNEERMLKNSYYRQQIAEAITRGIQDYDRGKAIALMEAVR